MGVCDVKSLAVAMGPVFCDYLSVTVPADCMLALADGFIESMGVSCDESDGLARVGSRGVVKYGTMHGVGYLSATGGVLEALREAGTLMVALSVVGALPHKVTRLDAALDVAEDSPSALHDLYARGCAGQLALTRKSIPASAIRAIWGVGSAGAETGTVYTGRRSSRVMLRAYDKLHEAVSKGYALPAGYFDQVGVTRYEVQLARQVGCTLRDVVEPAGVFWHHMATVLPRLAPDLPAWSANGEGFSVVKPEPDYWHMLDSCIVGGGLRRLGRVARGLGAGGVDAVMASIRKELERVVASHPLAAVSRDG